MAGNEVCIVHLCRVEFFPEDKDLTIERYVPNIRSLKHCDDFAFSSWEKADEYVMAKVGIEVDRCGVWHRKVMEDGSVWFVFYEDPYELDPPIPGNAD